MTTIIEPIRLTREACDKALDELIVEFGEDYVYVTPDDGQCANVEMDDDGRWVGSCLIGRMLIKLGLPVEWFVENTCNYLSISVLLAEFPNTVSAVDETRMYLDRIQDLQDIGKAWGHAVRSARRQYPA